MSSARVPVDEADAAGVRGRLAERGVITRIGYVGEAATNLSGGERRGDAYAWEISASSAVDLGMLWGWTGFRASLSASVRGGDDLSRVAGLGTLIQVQEVWGRGQQSRLGNLWLGWRASDGRLDIKAGRLPLHEDFNGTGCEAMNLSLCSGQALTFEGDYWFAGPVTQWGMVTQFKPSPRTYLRVGAYQVNPRYANERSGGWRIAPSGTIGTLTPVELGWEPGWRNGLPARYAVGGWYSSARRPDADQTGLQDRALWPGADAAPLMRSGVYGGWILAEQQFTGSASGDDPRGIRAQFAYTQGDRRTGDIDRMASLVGTWTGFHAARPQDGLGLGLAATHVNSRASRSWQGSGRPGAANDEYVAEAFYRWQVVPALALQPTVQYVLNPGGRSDSADAVVLGLKVVIQL